MGIYFRLVLMVSLLFSQNGSDISQMIQNRKVPKDISNTISMTLINSKGKKRTNKMISKSKDRNKKQIMWFLEPKGDRGVAFLKIEIQDKDDQMKMWLPAFKKVRRISSKKKGDSFMGSDLSYEDLSNRDVKHNNFKKLFDEIIDDKGYYVLETKPKKELNSFYSKHISWVNKENMTILKEESYDKKGELKKKKSFKYEYINSYFIATSITVEDVQKEHITKVFMSDISVDNDLPESLFHERSLRRFPAY